MGAVGGNYLGSQFSLIRKPENIGLLICTREFRARARSRTQDHKKTR